jgi:hypothetical protein
MYKAQFESKNFMFEAYGTTAENAINALKKGLRKHGRDYGVGSNWWKEFENDIYTIDFVFNHCYTR